MFEWLAATALAAAAADEAQALLQAADRPRAAFARSIVSVRATTRQADRPDAVVQFDLYVGGEDRQLVVFTDSGHQGRKLLLRDGKAWLFTPGTTHPVAISPNQRLAGGAAFADVARVRLADDYRATLRSEPQPCEDTADADASADPCRVLDIRATARGAPYSSGTLWVDARGLARRALYRLGSGKPAKAVRYEYREQDGRPAPARATITDLLFPEQALSTTLEYLDYRRTPLSPALFDPPQAADAP
jgi:hypothetical protein